MGQLLKKHIKNEKGLTLIELLAVIVILGIIAAIAIPSIANIIHKSREDAVKADAIQIINSAKMYIAGEGSKDTITKTDLDSYLNDVSTFSAFTVNVTTNATSKDTVISLTGDGAKGNVSIHFADATITDINNAEKGSTTIGD
ncbi:prepilin-type N-terminal cleavage/methylation domain-containing protein [Niallia taxi]|uniref:prepilin-type N-terminal cleavage/methylation domain-containing protein n=1 Tax=Niallia taxi TaxID=2499688 RepID=UPI002E1F74F7|nr:prepilin-type N-terminal cleavage/methylation domain-containing protein [Niallia taxi]MED4055914.1 prepilin-type N-terminal cleavage/methylation domain-containing protein [Niallia taxi]MED4117910.1 prepilin-type N-terminal cleavage/methylation domain-containing protein [Niallia taxi]